MQRNTARFVVRALLSIGAIGVATVAATFAVGTDPDTASVDVLTEVNEARPQLPPAARDRGLDVAPPPPLVEVMELESETVTFTVRTQGTVRPRTETVLSAEVAGAIVRISPRFIAGGVFEANAELMRIDPTNYEVAVEQAEALIAQRQIEFDGAERLQSQGYRAEAELASARAALATAKAELVRARRNLERTRISLPYAGMVRSKDADLGQYVNVGSRLGVAFSTDVAEVRLPLTDQDLAFIDVPDPVAAVAGDFNAGPAVTLAAEQAGRRVEWQGRIVRSEGVVDEATRVTYMVASVSDPYLRQPAVPDRKPLPMGTFVAAEIEGRTVADVIRVPRSALRGNGQLVVVNDESRLDIRDVDILRADAKYAYLVGGVAAGERVALTVIENPVNGMHVRTDTADAGDTDGTVAAGSSGSR